MQRGLLVMAACVAALAVVSAAEGARPLRTAFLDYAVFKDDTAALNVARVQRSGARFVRLPVYWGNIAPNEPDDPTNPADPTYRWDELDAIVRRLHAAGVTPILNASRAPGWAAEDAEGRTRPNAAAFAAFTTALARRYDGKHVDALDHKLPRVRYFQIWNEPNRGAYLKPQRNSAGTIVAADIYRNLVNAAARGIHDAATGNKVVAGGLAPLGRKISPAPFAFMRRLFRPGTKTTFDIWAIHTYTTGGPNHHAYRRDDVAVADTPEVRDAVARYKRLGRIRSSGTPPLWVTEFSWDSRPPDPHGVPTSLHARWTAEALYVMWRGGASLVTWFKLRDETCANVRVAGAGRVCFSPSVPGSSGYQSGLYACFKPTDCTDARKDHPKLALTAFRFPFVAFARKGRITLWGRTPKSDRHRVAIERRVGTRWRWVKTLRPNGVGVFEATLRRPWTRGALRARLTGTKTASLRFSLVRPKEPPYGPFGS